MCRHVAWIGRPRTLESVMLTGDRSLLVQSYAPREQRHGVVNADGFGVGWYAPSRPEPARLRRAEPIWTDASLVSLAGVVSSDCVLAAVRSATPPSPAEVTATAPFAGGRWLFSHNGAIPGFAAAAPKLRALLPEEAAASVESTADSALLWALTRVRLEAGASLGEALGDVVTRVSALAGGRLNLLATDGVRIAATTWGDTLSTRGTPDGVEIASEPTSDDDGWDPVPDRSLVVATATHLTITPLA